MNVFTISYYLGDNSSKILDIFFTWNVENVDKSTYYFLIPPQSFNMRGETEISQF